MYLGIYLLLGAIVACEAKEPPSLACKKMDQAGTTCLDNAQVSTPTTAAGTGSGGMTQAQMMQLMTMLQQNQQSGSTAFSHQNTVGQAIDISEEGLRARKLTLEKENARLIGENSSSNNAQKKQANTSQIEQNEIEIRSINERLDSIAEARKQPGFLSKIGDAVVGECAQNLGPCGNVVWKGIKGGASFIFDLLGGDDEERHNDPTGL